jgi:hypothetical protein
VAARYAADLADQATAGPLPRPRVTDTERAWAPVVASRADTQTPANPAPAGTAVI